MDAKDLESPGDGSGACAQSASENVSRVAELERETLLNRTSPERVADWVATWAGTATFAVIHVVWFALWIGANTALAPHDGAFDPYPFAFLTFVVSLESIFLAIAVLISQNRIVKQADRRAHLDLQVNLLAEQESTLTLQLVRQIAQRLSVEAITDPKVAQLAADVDVRDLLREIDEKVPSS